MAEEPDRVGVKLSLERHPFTDASPADEAGLRDFLVQQAEAKHVFHGQTPAIARFVGDGYVEVLLLRGLVEVGQEPLLARIVMELGGREGVLRTFREGEALVRADGDSLRRAVGVMEYIRRDDGSSAWWLAWCLVGVDAQGAGCKHGDWRFEEGTSPDTLPEGFDEWGDPGSAEVERLEMGEMTPNPTSMTGGLCAYNGPGPTDILDAVRIVAPQALPEVVRGGVAGLHVFVLSRDTFETYSLTSPPPMDRDDFVRNLAARAGGPALAVAVAQPTSLQTPQGAKRGIGLFVEFDGQRVLLFTEIAPGPEGARLATSGTLVSQQDLEEGAGWVGVEPKQPLELGVEWMQMPGGVRVPSAEA